jgi:hypothetical protein
MSASKKRGRAPKGAPKKGEVIEVETKEDGSQKATLKVPQTFSKQLRHTLKSPQWYRPVAFFDRPAQKIVNLDEVEVLLSGMFYQAGLSERILTLIDELEALGSETVNRKWVLQRIRAELGEPDLAMCLVPPAVSDTQMAALQMMLKANLRTQVLLLTNNVHLVKLRPVTDKQANAIMQEDPNEEKPDENKPGIVIPLESRPKGEGNGEGVREEDSEPPA